MTAVAPSLVPPALPAADWAARWDLRAEEAAELLETMPAGLVEQDGSGRWRATVRLERELGSALRQLEEAVS